MNFGPIVPRGTISPPQAPCANHNFEAAPVTSGHSTFEFQLIEPRTMGDDNRKVPYRGEPRFEGGTPCPPYPPPSVTSVRRLPNCACCAGSSPVDVTALHLTGFA